MWKRLKAWWAADLDLQRLRRLDDRLLADMGLNRDGLRARVMGTTEAKPVHGSPEGVAPKLCPPKPARC